MHWLSVGRYCSALPLLLGKVALHLPGRRAVTHGVDVCLVLVDGSREWLQIRVEKKMVNSLRIQGSMPIIHTVRHMLYEYMRC